MQKAACSLTSKAAGVNGRVFPLSPAGSVPAEVVLWKLLCSRSLNTKDLFFCDGKKDIPSYTYRGTALSVTWATQAT